MRLFWLSLLLLHGAAVPSVWSALQAASSAFEQASVALRVLGLAASAALFVAKMLDVPCLRLRPGWRSIVTAMVVIGVLHLGVAERAINGELASQPAEVGLVLFVGSACHAESVRRGLALVLTLITPARLFRRGGDAQTRRPRWWDAALTPAFTDYIPFAAGPRAPPLCSTSP